MLAGVDHASSRETDEDQYGGVLEEDTDPSTLAPMCGEVEFAELLGEMVAGEAPRLFAVAQEYSNRVDGRIAAWGMAFEDHVELVCVGDRRRMSLRSPERATCLLSHRPYITARLVWVTSGEARPPQGIDAVCGGLVACDDPAALRA